MRLDRIIELLHNNADENYKENVIKLGIPEATSIGVSTQFLRLLAKEIGKDDDLATDLWVTGYHEAKLLAVLITRPELVTKAQLDQMVTEIYSWELCDHFSKELVAPSAYADECIHDWVTNSAVFVRRAAFVLMCADVVKNKSVNPKNLDQYIYYCESFAHDDEVYVKKSIIWLLKEIGKFNYTYQGMVLMVCNDFIDYGSKTSMKIARDVLREVENLIHVPHKRRLVSSQSKAGKEHLRKLEMNRKEA